MFDLPYVPTADDFVDVAFRQGSKIARNVRGQKRKDKDLKLLASEERRVNTIGRNMEGRLDSIVEHFPSFDQLPEFYQKLLELKVNKDRYKKSLGALSWCSGRVRALREKTIRDMRRSRDKELSKRFLGRVSSMVKRISGDLNTLIDIKIMLDSFPVVKDEPTLVVAGYPNAGKSTFVKNLTGSNIKVAAYPFTTQSIMIGKIKDRHIQYQIIDSPGLLDRPMEKRNKVELEAVLALRYLANVVLFLVDPTGDIEKQLGPLEELRETFDTKIVVGVNKVDVAGAGEVDGVREKLGSDNVVYSLCANVKEECVGVFRGCFGLG